MDVWLGTLGLVYTRYSCSGKYDDRDFLRNGCFPIVWEDASVWVAVGIDVGIGILGGKRRVIRVQGRSCNRRRRPRGGEVVGYDCKRKQGYVVFLR